jgi:hypothetical protein
MMGTKNLRLSGCDDVPLETGLIFCIIDRESSRSETARQR